MALDLTCANRWSKACVLTESEGVLPPWVPLLGYRLGLHQGGR